VEGLPLDGLVSRILAGSPFDYRVAREDERDIAFRLRGEVVVERGWVDAHALPNGMERDEYDERAIHVIGWHGTVPMSTGRVVLPPRLPTEEACGLVVDPVGQVVDVGRMCVSRSHQGLEHAAFIGLMCRLYQVVRSEGFTVACGMMSAQAQVLVRHLGLRLEPLGPPRRYWNEDRTPVRFSVLANVRTVRVDAG
jgi:N-acyl-L-homoserine lactone synthetase